MTTAAGLTYRDGLLGSQERQALRQLLYDVFELDVSPVDELGLADPTYRAFSYLDATGRCVANAATFTLRLIIGGKPVVAMGIQSVATRPEWRRRGLSHRLLERALAWCDSTARLTFLMTSIPQFYAPMGFRIVPQFAYVGGAPMAAVPAAPTGRRLRLDVSEDRRLLGHIVRHKVPVSARFAIDGAPGSFVLNLLDQPALSAWYIEHKQAVLVTAERSDGVLCLVDIAAADIPTMAEVMAACGDGARQVEVHFPPDRLAWEGTAVPAPTSTVLMVRGDPGPLDPFMLPETAAF